MNSGELGLFLAVVSSGPNWTYFYYIEDKFKCQLNNLKDYIGWQMSSIFEILLNFKCLHTVNELILALHYSLPLLSGLKLDWKIVYS